MIKILVVDDFALMRRVLGDIFRSQDDFEVELARDGVDALAKLHTFRPDVMTLDVHMPNMDGLACLDRVMIERPCRVIMVSSLTADGAEATFEAMQLGAIDFVPKPSGAVSLAVDELGPLLIEKVRAAAKVRLRTAHRLTERVRLRAAQGGAIKSAGEYRKALPKSPATANRAKYSPLADAIVLVGTSTGGPPALDALLSPLPASFPWPIIIAQHMPATFTGPLAKRLDRLCALSVQEVIGPMLLAPGQVYIGRGDGDVVVGTRGDKSYVTTAAPLAAYPWHPSVDRLVSTAMEHLGSKRLVGVLLTGMGNDGASAMARMRAEGGRTIAEAEETAVVWGMPGELVKAGGADLVAPIDQIAQQLSDWGGMKAIIPTLSAAELAQFCEFLYLRTGLQYGESKRFYIERRLAERMADVGLTQFSDYLVRLHGGGNEQERLINSFTVNETYFYREDNQLRCLSRSLLPEVVTHRGPGDLVRIWSVPCSTGEEPYSLAIWLLENWALVDAYNIEIVGSDIDTRVLAEASEGVYGERALARLAPALIDRYFETSGSEKQIISDLRESVKFTQVNLMDPAATARQGRFDVIFCRNVLIYFDDASRLAASHNLFEALNPGGFICLGHSESMARISDRFVVRRFEDAIVYQRPVQ